MLMVSLPVTVLCPIGASEKLKGPDLLGGVFHLDFWVYPPLTISTSLSISPFPHSLAPCHFQSRWPCLPELLDIVDQSGFLPEDLELGLRFLS